MKLENCLEKGTVLKLDFGRLGNVSEIGEEIVPVVVQDELTKDVLMLAYANEQALDLTLKKGKATFWSISRRKLWTKGEFSGCFLEVVGVGVNCEQNSLLYLVNSVKMNDGICHVQDENGKYYKTCFYRKINRKDKSLVLENIFNKNSK